MSPRWGTGLPYGSHIRRTRYNPLRGQLNIVHVSKLPIIKQDHTVSNNTYIHTHHSRLIPKGVTETLQMFLRDTHILPK
jgi:hypothetical protein